MALIHTNPYAVEADDEGTLIDIHRAAWLSEGRHLPVGSRLVYGCGESGCISPAHGSTQPMRNLGNGWARVIVAAVAPHGNVDGEPAWGAVVEGPEIGRESVLLTAAARDHLGIGEAVEALEREFHLQRDEDGHMELFSVAEDDQLPGGVPAWHVVEPVEFDVDPRQSCPCGSRWRFGCCHGRS